jgi:hypothetical protein
MPTLPPALPKMVGIARVCALTCTDGVCKIQPCQYSVIGKNTEKSKRKGQGSKRRTKSTRKEKSSKRGKGTKRVVKSRRRRGSHTRRRRN